MEFQMIPVASIVGMAISGVVAIAFPIVLFIIGSTKFKAKKEAFLLGCGIFIVFALILEQLLHKVVLGAAGSALTDNIWAYALYGGLAAALFEEAGRFIAMNWLLKKDLTFENAFMYGAGHGGIEAILILGLTEINNISTSVMINTGNMPATLQMLDDELLEQTMASISPLWTTPSINFYMGGIERIFAIVLQIALSLIMYQAVKQGKKQYILLAFLFHFLVDAITVILASVAPVWAVEIVVAVSVVAVMMYAHKLEVANRGE